MLSLYNDLFCRKIGRHPVVIGLINTVRVIPTSVIKAGVITMVHGAEKKIDSIVPCRFLALGLT